MVNNLILLINFVGLLLLDALLATDPTVTQAVPASMEPGSEARITVTINKGDLSGFAKLQLDLPPGLSVTAVDTKGASFTFADQKAKFIWMALPAGPSFKITYTLKADANASGTKRISGRLSYIEENERKTYDMATADIDLGVAGQTTTTAPVAVVEMDEEDINADDLVSAAGGAPAKGLMVAVVEQAYGIAPIQGAGGISGQRVIKPISETELMVEVTINKADIRGFGKLQETVPQGFTAIESQSDEAIFTAQDRIVKFVWLNLPARNTVKVIYKLRADRRPDGEYSIDGEFGYLLNDETQKAVLGTSRFYIGPKAMELMAQDGSDMDAMENPDAALAAKQKAQREAEAKAKEAKATAEAKAKEEAAQAAALAQQQQKERSQAAADASAQQAPKTSPTPRIPAPEKGVTYKVQITAAHREVGSAYFKARHRYSGDFNIERHQGWIKYVTGGAETYTDARDLRNNLVQAGHEFPGPFVTAYNNGERITVQEALMLSNQQWVQ